MQRLEEPAQERDECTVGLEISMMVVCFGSEWAAQYAIHMHLIYSTIGEHTRRIDVSAVSRKEQGQESNLRFHLFPLPLQRVLALPIEHNVYGHLLCARPSSHLE